MKIISTIINGMTTVFAVIGLLLRIINIRMKRLFSRSELDIEYHPALVLTFKPAFIEYVNIWRRSLRDESMEYMYADDPENRYRILFNEPIRADFAYEYLSSYSNVIIVMVSKNYIDDKAFYPKRRDFKELDRLFDWHLINCK